MEAPEKIPDKIYLNISPFSGYPLNKWYKERQNDKDIEYTRIDVIVERAVQFIKERLNFADNAWYIEGEVTIKDKVIEDLKSYMKGE